MYALELPYELSIVQRYGQKKDKKDDFKQYIKPICTLRSLQNLSYILHHLQPVSEMQTITDINVFKQGIKPMWEDENNIAGGKWIVKLKKEVGQRLWERCVVHMVTGSFKTIDVNGIVASIRAKQFILSVWSKIVPKPTEFCDIIREIKAALGVESDLVVEFKDNDESLKDNSSFRNTLKHAQ
jgi:translation initiation factor 4E